MWFSILAADQGPTPSRDTPGMKPLLWSTSQGSPPPPPHLPLGRSNRSSTFNSVRGGKLHRRGWCGRENTDSTFGGTQPDVTLRRPIPLAGGRTGRGPREERPCLPSHVSNVAATSASGLPSGMLQNGDTNKIPRVCVYFVLVCGQET